VHFVVLLLYIFLNIGQGLFQELANIPTSTGKSLSQNLSQNLFACLLLAGRQDKLALNPLKQKPSRSYRYCDLRSCATSPCKTNNISITWISEHCEIDF
jgi:hypothetical protein